MMTNGLPSIPQRWRALAFQALPILAGVMIIPIRRQHMIGTENWSDFLTVLGIEAVAALPLLAAHLAAYRVPAGTALFLWISAFGLYPFYAPVIGFEKNYLPVGDWLIFMLLSAVGLLSGRRERGGLVDTLQRLPISLDGAIALLLGLWALAATFLFISTPDPVNNQPLYVWFNGPRIAEHPGLFLGYLLQFAFVASLLFAFYWACRYWLVRRLLLEHGWVIFLSASIVFWAMATPLIGSLIVLIPLNEPHWTILPSETPNPFAPINFAFSFVLWAIICPIVLVSERLLQEKSEAMSRHEAVRAELTHLQQQINPHFLFNTLNTLYALCLRDNQASAQAVVKLSDLLRYSVYEGQEEWVSLEGEITHLDNYLDLQRLRFGKRCSIETRWLDDAGQYRIPPQMLIMLVENAFKHGIEKSDQPGRLAIDLTVEADRMRFTCVNSPVAIADSATGLGLANLKRRLELLYGDDFVLTSDRQGDTWHAALQMGLKPC